MGAKLEVFTSTGAKKVSMTDSGHTTDTEDAHDASAISVVDSGAFYTGDDVEDILQELGTSTSSTVLGGGAFRKSIIEGDQAWWYTDFNGINTIVANTSALLDNGFVGRTSGTNSAVNGDTTEVDAANVHPEHPGIAVLSPGTTNAGVTVVANGHFGGSAGTLQGSIIFGTGKTRMGCWLYIPIASSAAGGQQFNVRAGFMDRDTQVQNNGCYFRYKDDVNSGKWEFVREVATVETAADTGVTVAAATWYKLEVEITANGETAEFFINGSSVGTVSDIAEGTTAPQFAGVHVGKTVGTTRRFLYVDAIYCTQAVNR